MGRTCSVCSMGPPQKGIIMAPQPCEPEVDRNQPGSGWMGPQSGAHVCVHMRESTLGSPRVMGEWDGNGTRPGGGGGVCQSNMEGGGSPGRVVVTNRRMHVQKVERSI